MRPPEALTISPWLTIEPDTAPAWKFQPPCQEILIRDVQRRGNQPGHVDPRPLPEQHPIRVHEKDLAVGP
jgi:hypothetical protein